MNSSEGDLNIMNFTLILKRLGLISNIGMLELDRELMIWSWGEMDE